jgi:DNA excision repair protein ERCC-8
MNQLLFDRATGLLSAPACARHHTSRLLHGLQAAPNIRFDGGELAAPASINDGDTKAEIWAHKVGVNAIVIDRFDGKLLISGGAESSIKIWDLDQITPGTQSQFLTPVGYVSK